MQKKESLLQKIVENCKKKYVNILPHNVTKKPEPEKISLEKQQPKKQFSKSQISQMIVQLSSIIQLLTQNYLLAQDRELKLKCYKLIKEFRARMLSDLDHFDGLMIKKHNTRLLKHKVNYSEMTGNNRTEILVDISPQISIYQDPLLCYLFQLNVHAQIFKNQIHDDPYKTLDIVERHVPVFNKNLLPIFDRQESGRAKFTKLEDRILLNAMLNFGYKNSKLIRGLFFRDKDEGQVRNRIKNLCAKPSHHPVRLWRVSEDTDLTDAEMKKVVRIFEEMGPRWKVISKYYDIRTSSYFESKYDPELKFMDHEDAAETFKNNRFMLKFRQFQQEMRLFNQPEQLFIVNGSNYDDISDNGDEWGCSDDEMMDIEMKLNVISNRGNGNQNQDEFQNYHEDQRIQLNKNFVTNESGNRNAYQSTSETIKVNPLTKINVTFDQNLNQAFPVEMQIEVEVEISEEQQSPESYESDINQPPSRLEYFNFKCIQSLQSIDFKQRFCQVPQSQQSQRNTQKQRRTLRRRNKLFDSRKKKRVGVKQNEKRKKRERQESVLMAMHFEKEILSMKRKLGDDEFDMGGQVEVQSLGEYNAQIEMQMMMVEEFEANENFFGFVKGESFRFQNL